jgi:DNA polymerase (family 10)
MRIKKNMNNQEIADLLKAVAAAYEIKKENLFRIRAYDNAADSIEHATREAKDLWEEGRIESLSGVGKNIALHIDELFRTGSVKHFKLVFKNIHPSVFEFIQIPGIGPKTANKLANIMQIKEAKKAVNRLKRAAQQGKIRVIEGFGEDSELAILKGIEEFERRENRILLPIATRISDEIINFFKKCDAVLEVDTLGSLRRRSATVGDIDISISTKNAAEVINHFKAYPGIKRLLVAGVNTARATLRSGQQVDVKTQTPDSYGALLQHFTGSKNHNIHLRELAQARGWSLSEHGIKTKTKKEKFKDEKSFYGKLGLEWIQPELREDVGEIEAAKNNKLPKLVNLKQIKGDLHLHTNYAWKSSHDAGVNSIQDLVDKAVSLGYDYIGIGDHNPSISAYSEKEITRHVERRTEIIEEHNYSLVNRSEKSTLKLLNTLEIDIRANGKLALGIAALKYLDYAVVSIHSSMRMSKDKMTDRILKGLSHPKAKILGHPTGRLLNTREGYEVDWQKLFKFMHNNHKFLEINAWPTRLDLPDTLVRRAVENNVKLVVNTDAHATDHMDLIRYGIDVARRGWATANDIINTESYKRIKELLAQ